jgi:ribosomal protein S21
MERFNIGITMARAYNVEVNISETRGDVTKLIRKFTKKVKKLKILEEYRDRRYYKKPSLKKKFAKLSKLRNARKAERLRQEKLDKKTGARR